MHQVRLNFRGPPLDITAELKINNLLIWIDEEGQKIRNTFIFQQNGAKGLKRIHPLIRVTLLNVQASSLVVLPRV